VVAVSVASTGASMVGGGTMGASTTGLGSMLFRPVEFVMIGLLLLGDKLKEGIPRAERTRPFVHCVGEVSWLRDG
jgi:hypothetical protein